MKTEADYLEFERLAVKLGIPAPSVRLRVESHLDGIPTGLHEGRSHTWTRNFWNTLIMGATYLQSSSSFGAGHLGIKKTDGNVATISQPDYMVLTPFGAVGIATRGIIPGRGTTAESFEHHVLATPITHGSGANQLGFRAQYYPVGVYTAGTKLWTVTLQRLFDNTSGASIVVTECGLYCYCTGLAFYAMNCRDLLASGVTVLHNGVLTITYTVTLTFPA